MGYILDAAKLMKKLDNLGILDIANGIRDGLVTQAIEIDFESFEEMDKARYALYSFLKVNGLTEGFKIKCMTATTLRVTAVTKKAKKTARGMSMKAFVGGEDRTSAMPDIPGQTTEDVRKQFDDAEAEEYAKRIVSGEAGADSPPEPESKPEPRKRMTPTEIALTEVKSAQLRKQDEEIREVNQAEETDKNKGELLTGFSITLPKPRDWVGD